MKPQTRGLTASRLRDMLSYDPSTGIFRWRVPPYKSHLKVGDVAGAMQCDGYIRIQIDGFTHTAGRLAWLHVHGRWPTNRIDHKNLNKSDNRFCNLRDATSSQNESNKRPRGPFPKGVRKSARKLKKPFYSSIRRDGRKTHLGMFSTASDAHAAYCEAAKEVFGEFARLK